MNQGELGELNRTEPLNQKKDLGLSPKPGTNQTLLQDIEAASPVDTSAQSWYKVADDEEAVTDATSPDLKIGVPVPTNQTELYRTKPNRTNDPELSSAKPAPVSSDLGESFEKMYDPKMLSSEAKKWP